MFANPVDVDDGQEEGVSEARDHDHAGRRHEHGSNALDVDAFTLLKLCQNQRAERATDIVIVDLVELAVFILAAAVRVQTREDAHRESKRDASRDQLGP